MGLVVWDFWYGTSGIGMGLVVWDSGIGIGLVLMT